MITDQELREAISECLGTKNPNANTCIKLAAFYIVQEHLSSYQKTSGEKSGELKYDGETEFSQAIRGKDISQILQIMDDLMTKLQAVNPRLYDDTMKKIVSRG